MSHSNREIDDLVNRFDQAWQSGDRPYLFAYLESVGKPAKVRFLGIWRSISSGEDSNLGDAIAYK